MPDSQVIQEFLVSLGFKLDDSQRSKFDAALSSNRARAAELDKTLVQVGKQLGILGQQLVNLSGEPRRKTEETFDRLAKGGQRLTAIAVATTSAYITGFTAIAKQYENLYYVQQRTGVSAQQLSALRYAGPQVGLGAGDLQSATEALAQAARNPGIKSLVESWGVASTDLQGIIRHLAALPPFLQDAYAGMLGISTTTMRNLINNQGQFIKAQDDFNKRIRGAGINYDQVVKQGVGVTRDLETIWSQLGITATKAFSEAEPYIDRILKKTITLLDAMNKFNASHPGAATAETGVATAAGAYGVGRVLGMIPGFKGVGSLLTKAPSLLGWLALGDAIGPYLYTDTTVPLKRGRTMGQYLHDTNPNFASGGIVPVNAHAGEIVLPQSLSSLLLQAAGQGGGGALGGATEMIRAWLYGNASFHPIVQILGLDPNAINSMAFAQSDGFGRMVGGGSPGGGGGRAGGSGSGPGKTGPVASSPLSIGSGSVASITVGTIAQAAAAVGVTDPRKVAIAQAAYLSAFQAESGLHYQVRLGQHVDANGNVVGRAQGHDVNIAQWVGSRRRHLQSYGPEDSLEAGQKQLYYELTQEPGLRRQFMAALTGDPTRAIGSANMFETGGGAFSPAVQRGHGAYFGKFLSAILGGSLSAAGGGSGGNSYSLTHNPILHLHESASDMASGVKRALNHHSKQFIRNAETMVK